MLNLSSKESELTESELTELELTQYLEEGGMGVEPLLNLKLIKIYLFLKGICKANPANLILVHMTLTCR
ncbi:unnamed protein product [Rhizophagus irregularis]|uniref:Uncharacterized protein n=1 Tax=Rhizophagus irregularis TaxID=588596 RepID=A0A915ZET8_9GLOM|nr:unnamed protein product [Rhizophagus irregularis]